VKCVYKPNIDKNLIPVHILNKKIISSVLSEKSRQICSGGKMTPEMRDEVENLLDVIRVNLDQFVYEVSGLRNTYGAQFSGKKEYDNIREIISDLENLLTPISEDNSGY
jgi:hypothetical protein